MLRCSGIWKLPACFAEFRTELEATPRRDSRRGRFVRVLQLLPDHPLARVRQAVEACRREQLISAEAVIQRTHTLAAFESQARRSPPWTTELHTVPQVQVPLPDLSRFNHLLDEPGQPRRSRRTKGSRRRRRGCLRKPGHRVLHLIESARIGTGLDWRVRTVL